MMMHRQYGVFLTLNNIITHKLKNEGVEYIFIDEVSMISCKVFAVLRDIKVLYRF